MPCAAADHAPADSMDVESSGGAAGSMVVPAGDCGWTFFEGVDSPGGDLLRIYANGSNLQEIQEAANKVAGCIAFNTGGQRLPQHSWSATWPVHARRRSKWHGVTRGALSLLA